MSVDYTMSAEPKCPICGGIGRPVLTLPAQPIYQHPVPADAVVPLPHTIDLDWLGCTDCAHAWQPTFDRGLLEQIYRSHYYTPAPDGIAAQFRNDFIATLERFGLMTPRRALLEIGASDGDVLAELKMRTSAVRAYAFEPNVENASVARGRGLDVREQFFDGTVAGAKLDPVDLIYARHVIEHIFDFDDFFAGVNGVASTAAELILETPSLDYAGQGSIEPFHIEHVHVFSLRSLARLAASYGWGLQHSAVTTSGNLIACFGRGAAVATPPYPSLQGLQDAVDQRRAHLRSRLEGRSLIFWGAGSAGLWLVSMIGREPELWTDGNPNKVGKKFAGSTRLIISPERAFAEAGSAASGEPVLVIASSFVEEILPRVRQLGWKGEVIDMAGNGL